MSRNRKPEYIKKLIHTTTPNGYRFDIANYLYNPHRSYEYPSFIKKLNETESDETFRRVYYFKYNDGSGEYIEEVYTAPKTKETWRVIPNPKETVLESSPRFSLAKLISFC